MALGATRADALKLVLGMGMRFIAQGVAIGSGASLVLSRALASHRWKVSVYDPVTMTGVAAILLATGALACWVPARRATGIEPTLALHHD